MTAAPDAGEDLQGAAPTPAPLDGVVGFRLRRLQARLVSHWSRWFRGLGLQTTPVQGGILLLISDNPGLTQVGLSRLMQVETPTLVQALGPLLEAGLVERTRSARDRRAFELRLTTEGQTAAEMVRLNTLRHEEDLLAGLSPAERETLLALLDKAIASADVRVTLLEDSPSA